MAYFIHMLKEACKEDLFANPLMIPPSGGADFDLGNFVPAKVSFLKYTFIQWFHDPT